MSKRGRYLAVAAIAVAAVVAGLVLSGGAVYEGPVSDHFDGEQFFGHEPDHSFGDMIKWWWDMETVDWPKWVEDPVQPSPPDFVDAQDIGFTYINHATTLIQIDSVNILTDPIWSERAGPVRWMGVKRVRRPGVPMDSLPRIDCILISHDHYDHLDLPTLRQLGKTHNPLILAGLGVGQLLTSEGLTNVVELDWWQSQQLPGSDVTITFVPAEHQSGRTSWRGNGTLWGGFVIEGPAGRVYFAGDTGFGSFLREVAERFDGFRLTILPVGNYEKRWIMRAQHMNPDDAVAAHTLLGSRQSVAIHYGTFAEHPEQSINAHERDLTEALARRQIDPARFWVLSFGESRFVPR